MDVETANGFAKLLAYIINPNVDYDDDLNKEYERLKVGTPIINNVVVTIPSGKQYMISVKPTSGWEMGLTTKE